MSRFIAVLAVVTLLCVGSVANGALTLTIAAADGGTAAADWAASFDQVNHLFTFETVVSGLGADTQLISGAGIGVQLRGATSGFSSSPLPAAVTTFQWPTTSGIEVQGTIPGGANNTLAESYAIAEDFIGGLPKATTVSDGFVIARFAYNWNGSPPAGNLIITVMNDTMDAGSNPYLFAIDANQTAFDVAVTNNNIPEPATLSLLGLGLAGLLARRRKGQ